MMAILAPPKISSSTCLIGVFDLGGVARAAGLGGRLEVPGRPLP